METLPPISTASSPFSAPAAPMTALQKLAASRKATSANKEGASSSATSSAPAASTAPVATPSDASSKPMTKLAQLAAARKAGASNLGSSAMGTISKLDATKSQPKPLSKLSQRIAAARAAKHSESQAPPSQDMTMHMEQSQAPANYVNMEPMSHAVDASPLFTFTAKLAASLSPKAAEPSTFFSLLTSPPKDALPPPPARYEGNPLDDPNNPFNGPSPDDVVLQKRENTRLGGGKTGAGGSEVRRTEVVDSGSVKKQRMA